VEDLPEGVAVTTAELPACSGGDPSTLADGSAAGSTGETVHVAGLESAFVTDACLRVVVSFGSGPAGFFWDDLPPDTGPADTVPNLFTTMSGGSGLIVDLGTTDSAWPAATETDDGVFLVREPQGSDGSNRGDLNLVVLRPADGDLTLLPDRGLAVLDLTVEAQPPTGSGVALSAWSPMVGRGSVQATGVARPFEANLEVQIEDAEGRPVEAVYSGSTALGTTESTGYGVQTTDWTEAWGRFGVRAEGLEPGAYTLVLNATGGADGPTPLRVPFTIEEAGPAPLPIPDAADQAVAANLIAAAKGQLDLASLPLADEVVVMLGPVVYATPTAAELAEPAPWRSEEMAFAEAIGEFSALDVLARSHAVRFTEGPIPWCAGPARRWPGRIAGLRQVTIEPVGIDSCIEWFGVSLFIDDNDRIAGVALDLFGP
jgi:hypothetical protein